jgi:hypothetical protein
MQTEDSGMSGQNESFISLQEAGGLDGKANAVVLAVFVGTEAAGDVEYHKIDAMSTKYISSCIHVNGSVGCYRK